MGILFSKKIVTEVPALAEGDENRSATAEPLAVDTESLPVKLERAEAGPEQHEIRKETDATDNRDGTEDQPVTSSSRAKSSAGTASVDARAFGISGYEARATPVAALAEMEAAAKAEVQAEGTEEESWNWKDFVTKEKEGSLALYVPSGSAVNPNAPLPSFLQKKGEKKPSWMVDFDTDEKQMIASAIREKTLNKRMVKAGQYKHKRADVIRRRKKVQKEENPWLTSSSSSDS